MENRLFDEDIYEICIHKNILAVGTVGTQYGHLHIYDITTGKKKKSYELGGVSYNWGQKFTSDGKYLISLVYKSCANNEDENITVINMHMAVINMESEEISIIKIDNNSRLIEIYQNRYVFVSDYDEGFASYVYDLVTQKLVTDQFKHILPSSKINNLKFIGDDSIIYSTSNNIDIYNYVTKEKKELISLNSYIYFMDVTSNGKKIATGSDYGQVTVHEFNNEKLTLDVFNDLYLANGNHKNFVDVLFSPSGRYVVIQKVIIKDLLTGNSISIKHESLDLLTGDLDINISKSLCIYSGCFNEDETFYIYHTRLNCLIFLKL